MRIISASTSAMTASASVTALVTNKPPNAQHVWPGVGSQPAIAARAWATCG